MQCYSSFIIIMNFILKLAYLYKLTEKKILIYMHLLLLSIVLCGLPGPQERRIEDLEFSVYNNYLLRRKDLCTCILLSIIIII